MIATTPPRLSKSRWFFISLNTVGLELSNYSTALAIMTIVWYITLLLNYLIRYLFKFMAQPKSGNRTEKLNSLIQQIVGASLFEYLDGQAGIATVSRVETSGDARWAKVWVSILGGDDDSIFAAIKKNIYDIQGNLNNQLGMKMTPRLSFYLDTDPRYAQHIDELIRKIHKEEGEPKTDDGENS